MEGGLKPRGLLLKESSNAIFLPRSNCGELETSTEEEFKKKIYLLSIVYFVKDKTKK